MTTRQVGYLALAGLVLVGVGLFLAWMPLGIVYAGGILLALGKFAYDEASNGTG